MREALERCLAGLLFFAVLPILAIAAAAIVIEDGFPILFLQQRVGKAGVLFNVFKLRSMRNGSGPMVTAAGDSRITKTGWLLRKYKLDEVVQLWNVVRGDMSLVGPRPEVPKFVDLNNPLWQQVLSVKPGITDVSTLAFRDEESILKNQTDPEAYYRTHVLPHKLRLQTAELRNRSWRQDLRVLAKTVYFSSFPRSFDGGEIRNSLLVGQPRDAARNRGAE